MNIGDKPKSSDNGMVTTICWSTENRVDYALEGAIVSCGATVEWVKNTLGLFKQSKKISVKSVSSVKSVFHDVAQIHFP